MMRCFHCGEELLEESEVCKLCGKPMDLDADRFFKAGMSAMASGDLADAVCLLSDCVRLDPGHINGRYNLGMALCLASRCDEAIEEFEIIIEEEPEYSGIYTALGQAAFGSYLEHQQRIETRKEAMIRYLITAIELDPDDVDAHFSLANAYIAMDSPEKSIPWLRNALHLHPNSPAIHYTIAKALKMLGRFDEASLAIEKSMRLSGLDDPFRPEIEVLFMELQEIHAAR